MALIVMFLVFTVSFSHMEALWVDETEPAGRSAHRSLEVRMEVFRDRLELGIGVLRGQAAIFLQPLQGCLTTSHNSFFIQQLSLYLVCLFFSLFQPDSVHCKEYFI